ncbi:MAG: exodeoxyribonuclease VII small subunit [Chitinispirillaceae bacterium]|nr:exodeoxyribonuclease VII small subunit [Chitinispirillaceae bacterium]
MAERQRTKKTGGDALTFEEALAQLEKTVDRLEKEELTLDGSLKLFEQGIGLIRTCDEHLKKAKGKVTELLKNDNGDYVEKVLGDTLESFITEKDGNE